MNHLEERLRQGGQTRRDLLRAGGLAGLALLTGCASLSASKRRPAQATGGMEGTLWGFTNDFGIHYSRDPNKNWRMMSILDENMLRAARESGMTVYQYVFYWPMIEPKRGEFHWDHPDESVSLAHELGYDIFAKMLWAPAWATGGIPWYEPWRWAEPKEKGMSSRGLPDLDRTAFQGFIQRVLDRYPFITKLSVFNEVEYDAFWPPGGPDESKTESRQGILERKARSAIEHLILPAREVLKEYPHVKMLGSENHAPDMLETYFRLEQEYGRLFDIVTSHAGYGHNTFIEKGRVIYPEDAFRWLDDIIKPTLDRYGGGRECWLTEGGVRNDLVPNPDVAEIVQAYLESRFYKGVAEREWIKAYVRYHICDGRYLDGNDQPGYGLYSAAKGRWLRAAYEIAEVINPRVTRRTPRRAG